MATTADFAAIGKKKKFKVREYHRCLSCGRARGFLRHFEMCRMCFRQRSLRGEVPGVTKASW